MRYAVPLLMLLVAPSCAQPKVDPDLVGTWELNVPNPDGVARWVWAIHADGSYDFHAEGPGNVPAHSGTFEARNGRYSLRSTTIAWVDSGTYRLVHRDTLSATGRLGTGAWTRVAPASIPSGQDSGASQPADTSSGGGTVATGRPAIYTGPKIYDFLSHERFDSTFLAPPLTLAHDFTVDLDAQQKADGVVGLIEVDVAGSSSPATITFVAYRDRAAAEAAHDVEAVYDSKNFRMQPGEFVGSHIYDHHEQGHAECLSRHVIGTTTATVTCYMLVGYPTREPLMIEGRVSESVAPRAHEASGHAVQHADDLLFAGIKEWALVSPEIGRQ